MTARLYTGRGDDGLTDLFNGTRVAKHDPRIEAVGAVDELNAAIGLVLAACDDAPSRDILTEVQHRLFELGADLATPAPGKQADKVRRMNEQDAAHLERAIDTVCEGLPPLREFILPGGSETAARLHLARTVCRRAERACAALGDCGPCVVLLNRLGDLLFALARRANQATGVDDVPWRKTS